MINYKLMDSYQPWQQDQGLVSVGVRKVSHSRRSGLSVRKTSDLNMDALELIYEPRSPALTLRSSRSHCPNENITALLCSLSHAQRLHHLSLLFLYNPRRYRRFLSENSFAIPRKLDFDCALTSLRLFMLVPHN
jgi:hypothetical protein